MSKLYRKIKRRNEAFLQIREFFAKRNVLEVDTALIRQHSVTDPYMKAFSVSSSGKRQGYLQTSPEYAMKSLLCNGSSDIFQLGKMFRAEEASPIHLNEFTLLEWYRIGYDHHMLIKEVCSLIELILGKKPVVIHQYYDLFIECLLFDPRNISLDSLSNKARTILGDLPENMLFDNYLTLLFSEKIEPCFDVDVITIVTDYPESQASLAKTRKVGKLVTADRFEIFLGGVELANGFNELTDENQQVIRFKKDNLIRKHLGYKEIDIDIELLESLKRGLPDCAGVALGVDRLLMIKFGESNIEDVVV